MNGSAALTARYAGGHWHGFFDKRIGDTQMSETTHTPAVAQDDDMNANGEAIGRWLTAALTVVAAWVQTVLGPAAKSCDAFLSYPSQGGNPVANNPVAWEVVEAGRVKGRTTTKHGISDRPAILLSPHKVKDATTAVMYLVPAYLSVLIPPEVQTTKADGSPLAGGRRVLQFPKAYADAYAKLGYSGKPERPILNGTVATTGGEVPEAISAIVERLGSTIEAEAGDFPTDAVEAWRDARAETGRNVKMLCSTQQGMKFTQKTRGQEHFSGSTTMVHAEKYAAVTDKETGLIATFWPCPRRFVADEAHRCDGFIVITPNDKQVAKNREKYKQEHPETATAETPANAAETATGTDGGNIH